MLFVGKQYHRLNWVMQLHYGCKRDNNTLRSDTEHPMEAKKSSLFSSAFFRSAKVLMAVPLTSISLANLGNLSGFVGMLTDSRSFLSYTRHEYFRRILCNMMTFADLS